jgi:DNA-binding MarR family transcriptional regulator
MSEDPRIEHDMKELTQFFFRFIRNAKAHGRGVHAIHEVLTEAGFGPRHVQVLFALAMYGPDSVGELAGRMGLNPATVSQLVNELHRGGFVDRSEDPRDRRRTIVSLPERYKESFESYARQRQEPLRVTLQTLSAEERAHFLKGWRILVEAQEAQGAQDAQDAQDAQGELSPGA